MLPFGTSGKMNLEEAMNWVANHSAGPVWMPEKAKEHGGDSSSFWSASLVCAQLPLSWFPEYFM